MDLPTAQTLGICYGLSEVALGIFKRSGAPSRETDRSSLRFLWLVILASIALAIVAAKTMPQFGSQLLAVGYSLGVLVFVLGLALRWYAIVYLGRFFTVDVAIAEDHRVVDSGPYRVVRHPSYTGALLGFLGFGICLGNWLSLAVVILPIALAFMRRIHVEEAALNAALGERYAAYARHTKRLVPWVY
ncbi:MAG: isoprenylcysteine carboxylmethyltransferase family protein [Steroidobacteraceae bacterium]|nr:isoprenylcysteine carboxylmethyltransferase family protein [Steroidobacteraceae bacterium]